MRTKINQGKHDSGVIFWSGQLIKEGWSSVYADLPGKAKPPQIGGYIPDVYGKHDLQEIIVEIETTDSIDLEQTKLQLRAFEAWKNQSKSRRFLIKLV